MCKCFEELKKKIEDKIIGSIGDHVEFKGNWEHKVFFFGDNPPTIPVVIPFKYSYKPIKVSGIPYKNTTTNSMNVTMSYCPFCGKKTESE